MPVMRMSAKGQVVIPAEIRKSLGVKPGTYCYLHVQDGELIIMPRPENPVESLRGSFRRFGTESLTEDLLRERALDKEGEERKYQRLFGPKPEAPPRSK
jgi:AbrB family looped-hinge helix DNA binding protein